MSRQESRLKTILLMLTVMMANDAAMAEGLAKTLSLPPPSVAGSLEQAMMLRRSVREFASGSLTLAEISRLLWAAQGITAPGRRTAPSAGATYPLDVYLAVGDVQGLAAGVYRYRPDMHRLEAVSDGDIRPHLATAALEQKWIGKAAAVVVIAASFDRTTVRYGKRGERYVYMEAGHAAQNLLLQAATMGLGATTVGAFNDTEVSRLLRLIPIETPLYLIPVGKKQ